MIYKKLDNMLVYDSYHDRTGYVFHHEPADDGGAVTIRWYRERSGFLDETTHSYEDAKRFVDAYAARKRIADLKEETQSLPPEKPAIPDLCATLRQLASALEKQFDGS